VKEKEHTPRAAHLVVDGTYFGERTEETSWCVIVARDEATQENLWWTFCHAETTGMYRQMREELTKLGYTVLSVTGDGFGGIHQAFLGIPYQMCQVHMERLVIKGTTRKPKTEAGVALLALVRLLRKTDSHTFKDFLKKYIEHFRSFLNERSVNPETGREQWTHDLLRKAVHSLVRFEPFLFTYEHNKNIPRTTNSLEGHFRHVNEVVAIHCGLTRPHKERVIHTILLAGTIAPNEEKLREII
jgi:Transposase IS66 family